MKNHAYTSLLIQSSLAVALIIWSPAQAQSAEPAQGKKMMEGKMMEHCQAMKEQKQKMKVDMKAHDAELTEQVAKMNSAPKDQKTDLMAALLTNMVEQRIAMHARTAKMKEEMMQHMHMGKESMAKCHMKKSMDEKPVGAQHQAEKK
ncbi:MAG: hypothetical protein ACI915_002983 [Gammaproteobacteria bacterium]|jgi:hypothetical protein